MRDFSRGRNSHDIGNVILEWDEYILKRRSITKRNWTDCTHTTKDPIMPDKIFSPQSSMGAEINWLKTLSLFLEFRDTCQIYWWDIMKICYSLLHFNINLSQYIVNRDKTVTVYGWSYVPVTCMYIITCYYEISPPINSVVNIISYVRGHREYFLVPF